MSESPIFIIKADGERVPFEIQKLRDSLRHAGAGKSDIDYICDVTRKEIVDNSTTKSIYQRAFKLLKQRSEGIAGRYKLKRALAELGPSGYPFEQYIGEVLRNQGYEVTTNAFLEGKCIQHEVDVMAKKGKETIYVECKFHNNPSAKSDVKVPLYVLSRINDIVEKNKEPGHEYQGWVVTNTRFTEEAEKFGHCSPLKLISWSYPESGSLKERIELSGLYPLTCLVSLSKKQKDRLLKTKIVLSKSLLEKEQVLKNMGLSESKIKRVMNEVKDLIMPQQSS